MWNLFFKRIIFTRKCIVSKGKKLQLINLINLMIELIIIDILNTKLQFPLSIYLDVPNKKYNIKYLK